MARRDKASVIEPMEANGVGVEFTAKGIVMTAKDDHKEEARSEEPFDGSLYSVKRPAKRTKGTVKDTAQQYLDIARTRLDLEEIKETIRDRPYHSLVIAASAGFLFGGGFATTAGIVLLSSFRRKAVRGTVSNLGRQIVGRSP